MMVLFLTLLLIYVNSVVMVGWILMELIAYVRTVLSTITKQIIVLNVLLIVFNVTVQDVFHVKMVSMKLTRENVKTVFHIVMNVPMLHLVIYVLLVSIIAIPRNNVLYNHVQRG